MTKTVTGERPADNVRAGAPATVAVARRPGLLTRGPVGRIAASGFARIAGISASLVGTQALTSILGLVFWAVAARQYISTEVGIAGAAVALMMLLGSLGSLGLGTVLIARLPGTAGGDRRVLVRTAVAAAATGGTLLGLVVPAVAVQVFGAVGLAPVAGTLLPLLLLAVGTGLTSAVIVLDQAVLTIGIGTLQLERNVVSSVVKILALLALPFAGAQGGMTIFLAWAIGNAVSLPLVAWRTRGGRALAAGRRLLDPRALRGLGKLALSHHALNVSIQAALQLLPVLVTILVSAQQNARFNAAIMLAGFVFALPYAVSVGLFAAARGKESEVVSRMRLTIPFGLAVSATAILVLFPLAEPVLHIFGPQYAAEGAVLLRLVVLAGLPFVIKDHFIALRRVQGRTTSALVVTAIFLVAELAAAAGGAVIGGTVGLCVGWLAVLAVEAVILAVPLVRALKDARRTAIADDTASASVTEAPARQPESAELSQDGVAVLTSALEARSTSAAVPAPGAPDRSEAAPRRVPPWFRRNLAGPTLSVMAVGVLVMAGAANAGRDGITGALPVTGWTVGLVLLFMPAVVRVAARATPNNERILVAVGLGLMLQLSRLVLNPTLFAFHDELIHATTLHQISDTERLFTANPLLPVSAYYPGLEVVTNGVQAITGLPDIVAAAVTLLAARLVMVLAVLGLTTLVTGSRRAGAVAVVVYLANPQLLFFNSQYSYQSLALPLAALAMYLFAARRRRTWPTLVLPIAVTAAVVLTHHLTAALLVVAYAVWLVVVALRGRHGPAGSTEVQAGLRRRVAGADLRGLAILTAGGAAMLLLSVLNPGNPLAEYLGAIFGSSSSDINSLFEGRQTKALFADSAGTGPAPWEQVLLIAAVLIATASLLIALGFVRRSWRAGRPLALLLGLVALLYPVIPGGHLTRATAEVGDRASGFVFLGLAVVVGAWWWQRRHRSSVYAAFVLGCTVLFLGNIVLGAGPTARQLPGPYEISSDARSVDARALAGAEWLSQGVPRNSVVYGDRTLGGLAAAYGHQETVLHVATNIDASQLLLAPTYTDVDRTLIQRARLDYLVVDERISSGLPHQQVYIENGEYGGDGRTTPVSGAALTKFSAVDGVDRLYDNGSIVVYDVERLK